MNKLNFAIAGFLMLFCGCTALRHDQGNGAYLFKIDQTPVSPEEFKYVYEKNNFNNDSIYQRQDIEKYLNLYIDFKLKIQEAKAEGYDTTQAFLNEYNKYKEQLIKPYLPEAQEIDKLVKQAYERMKTEVDASHILVRLPENPSPKDTLAAYQKIMEIRQKALDGGDFEQLAKQFSEDPSAKQNGGNLGYFTVFQMVYPFEEAAYTTPVGHLSNIVRTRFGYHIIKVNDKRPALGTVKVAHIMVRVSPDKKNEAAAREKIFEIHDQLSAGADWNRLCSQFSDDLRTKNSGGVLPYFGTGQVDSGFSDAAFSLDSAGQFSDPFETRYGWHIVKLIDKKPIGSFESLKAELESKVRRDTRSKLGQQAVRARLKAKYGFQEHNPTLDSLALHVDSTLTAGRWHPGNLGLLDKKALFEMNGKSYNTEGFVDFVQQNESTVQQTTPKEYLNKLFDQYVDDQLYAAEEQNLIATNTEFRNLLNEYYEGILLFDIMQKNVWNKASSDSVGLAAYFNAHREKYAWKSRAEAVIFDAANQDVLSEIKNKYLDKDTVLLVKAHISLRDSLDSAQKRQLAKAAQLFAQATEAQILLHIPAQAGDTAKLSRIKAYLATEGVPRQSLVEKYNEGHGDSVDISLVSSSKKSLELLYNKESALTLQVEDGKFEPEGNDIFQKMPWKPGTFEANNNGRAYLVKIRKIIPPEPKKLDETRGAVISDYQNYLERQWVGALKKKFKVEIDHKELDKIFRDFEAKRAADHP